MAAKLTRFYDLNIGHKFTCPGEAQVYVKTTGNQAQRQGKKGVSSFTPGHPVVPEFTATVDDILNSWRNL